MPDLAGLAVAAGGLEGAADAGAIDQDPLLPDQPAGPRETGIHFGIGRHIDLAEDAADVTGDPLAKLGIEIEQRDLDPVRSEPPRGRGPEAGPPPVTTAVIEASSCIAAPAAKLCPAWRGYRVTTGAMPMTLHPSHHARMMPDKPAYRMVGPSPSPAVGLACQPQP